MMNTEGNGELHDQAASVRPAGQPNDSPGLLIEALRRHPLIVVGTCALVLVGAFVYVDRATPLYKSMARIYVERNIPRVIRDSEEGIMTRSDNYLYTQAAVLKSVPVLARAVDLLEEKPVQLFAGPAGPLGALQRHLATEVGKMDSIIDVSFEAPHPAEAAAIANAVVDAYIDFHSEQKRQETVALLKILQEERKQRNAELAQKHEQMLEFRRQHESLALGTDLDDNIVARQMEALLTQLTEAKVATEQSKSFYERAQATAHDPAGLRQLLEAHTGQTIGAAEMQEVAALKTELRDRERQKADVFLELKSDHPGVLALDAGIQRTQQRIAELNQGFVQRQLAVVQEEYQVAKQREEELEKQYEAWQQQVLQLNAQQAEYAVLQADYERARGLTNVLDERIRELNVTEQVGGLTVTILERALAAAAPVEPKKARILAIALLLGACAGVGLALVRELLDVRVRSSQEIAALLRLPVLGAIPAMRRSLRGWRLRAQMVRLSPLSPEAEAFRRLQTPLLLGLLKEKAKAILVTSPVSGEGKSLVVSNLALTMAQAGKKVLIVDADCHAPEQHRNFKKGRHMKGLSLLLSGQMSLEEAIESTDTPNLDILTCGPDLGNAAEMLVGERARTVIAALVERYDRVLIDSPPLLSFTDAQVLAAQCDGVLLVLRADTSTRQDSVQACGELVAVNANVLGVVVNAAPRRDYRYRYGAYHRYSRPIEVLPAERNAPRHSEGRLLEPLLQGRS